MPTATIGRSASTFERFLRAVEHATALNAHGDGEPLTDKGMRHSLDLLREAEPIARAMVLIGNPPHHTSDTIEAFLRRRRACALAEATPDPECDISAAEHDALFHVGLAIGLLVADQV